MVFHNFCPRMWFYQILQENGYQILPENAYGSSQILPENVV